MVLNAGLRCLWMRGGTSKGAFFLASDLPDDAQQRDALLLAIMGSPDPRQIDGIGGGDPLTSKVAILSPSSRGGADVDYLFLQVFVDRAVVSDAQPCGNILAAVGPAAIEFGLVLAQEHETAVKIHMLNTGEIARAIVQTPHGYVSYHGDAEIDGVPGHAAPIALMFENIAGGSCGQMLPSGQSVDIICGIRCTLIDNGMPCVIMAAQDFGLTGYESLDNLDQNLALKSQIEAIRLIAGPIMNLGDVTHKSTPKMTLVSAPIRGGTLHTRSFIPHKLHASIGVLAAVSVATACLLPGTPAADLAKLPRDQKFLVEHPSGSVEILVHCDARGQVCGAGVLRTARKLMQGQVFAKT